MKRIIIMGTVVFSLVFGLTAHAQQARDNVIEQIAVLSELSATQCSSDRCRDEAIALIRDVRDFKVRVERYKLHMTQQEYDSLKSQQKELVDKIEDWGKRHKIVPKQTVGMK